MASTSPEFFQSLQRLLLAFPPFSAASANPKCTPPSTPPQAQRPQRGEASPLPPRLSLFLHSSSPRWRVAWRKGSSRADSQRASPPSYAPGPGCAPSGSVAAPHAEERRDVSGCKVEGDGSPRAEERRAVGRRHRGPSLSPTSTGRFQWFLSPSITGTSALRPPLPIPQRHHRYASRCCATLIQISLFKVWREWQTDFG